ncbi:hypothetical protein RhiJN_09016 [Ceratobasidium sp. AG-Ba]|nr:hypothetical protein RhiJN_09016 [Ceratobasidium sp. AG-Ba]
MAANPQAAQQFAQLCAGFLAAQNNQNPQGEGVSNDPPSDEQDRRPRSLTLGRSSDPAHSVNGNERDRTPQHNTSPLSRRTVQASGPPSQEKSESPPRRSKNTPARLKGRSRAQELPHSTPPPLSQSDKEEPNPTMSRHPHHSSPHSSSPAAPKRHTQPRNNSPPARDSSPTLHQSSRSAKPPPSRTPHNWSSSSRSPSPIPRHSSPVPQATSSRQHRGKSPDHAGPKPNDDTAADWEDDTPATPNPAEYDTCETSYETGRKDKKGKKKRGGRKKDKQGRIIRTALEKLVKRKRKYEFVKENRHLFGIKHGMHFNPYSGKMAALKYYKRVPRPKNVQLGRGGFLWHEKIGLRMDYEFAKGILLYLEKAIESFRPKITLAAGKTLTWAHYGTARQREIYNHMYQRYPFLQHFLDESGEDSWIIPMLARRYLTGRGSYHKKGGETKKKNSKKDENPGEEEEEELGGPEASANNPDEYDDDYTENGIVHPTSSNPRPTHSQSGPPGTSGPRSNHPQTTPALHTTTHQPTSTERENRRADKVVAREEARAKTHETQTAKDTSQALKNARAIASTLSKGKGKQRASPTRDPTPATDSDEEVVRRTTTKVKPGARKHARIVSPEPEDQTTTTHKEKNTSSSSKKRKVAEVEPDHEEVEVEVEGPAGKQKKPKPSSTTTANKRKVIEPEAEIEDQETQEPPTKKTKARPKMRPQPPPEPTSTHPPSTVDNSSDTAASQPAGVLDLASSSSQVAGSSRKPIPVGSSDPAEAVTGATTKASRAKGPRAVGTIKISVPPSRRSGRLNANSE